MDTTTTITTPTLANLRRLARLRRMLNHDEGWTDYKGRRRDPYGRGELPEGTDTTTPKRFAVVTSDSERSYAVHFADTLADATEAARGTCFQECKYSEWPDYIYDLDTATAYDLDVSVQVTTKERTR